jgi:TonB family protein
LRPDRGSVRTGPFVASLLLHAGLVGAFGLALAREPGKPPLSRVDAEVEFPILLEEEIAPIPVLDLPEPAPVPETAVPELAGDGPVETVDPRMAEEAAVGPSAVGAGDLFGLGEGRYRSRPRRQAVPEAAGVAEAVEPAGPSFAASLLPEGRREPVYPSRERRLGVEGVVLLLARIDATGAVAGVDVLESSGSPALDRAATDAVHEWRFSPALKDGVPVEDSLRLRIRFSLVDPGRASAGR